MNPIYRQKLERLKGQRQQILNQLNSSELILSDLQKNREDLETAQTIIQLVSQATQEELKYHISELVSLALASVFDNPYEFEVDFQLRRSQIEADLWFLRDGERVDPLTASGGGAVDVAAFALRLSLWSLKNKRTRPILILDEPFQHIKGERDNIKAIQMVKEVSERLGIQILMISDERVPLKEIENGADRVFRLSIKKKVSQIERI